MDIGGIDGGAGKQALNAALRVGGEAGTGTGLPEGAPAANDVEKLQEAMKAAELRNAETQEPSSLGERVLEGMQAASRKIQDGRSEAMSAIGREDVSQVDLLRANFAMLETNTLVTAVSKTTEKITQGVKNLQQG